MICVYCNAKITGFAKAIVRVDEVPNGFKTVDEAKEFIAKRCLDGPYVVSDHIIMDVIDFDLKVSVR